MISISIDSLIAWLSVSFFCLPFFAVAKGLTLDWRPRFKEAVFVFCACLVVGAIILINRLLHPVFTHLLGDLALIFFLVLYLHKVQLYPIRKAITLMMLACVIVIIAELGLTIVSFVFSLPLHPIFSTQFTYAFPTSISSSWFFRLYLPLYVSIALVTVILLWLSKNLRPIISRSIHLQKGFMFFSIYCIAFLFVIVNVWRAMAFPADLLTPNILFVFIFACILFALFTLFTIAKFSELEARHAEAEQQKAQTYAATLEQQQVNILKFKHDYKNLLLSMQAYIHDKDWAGLEQFYASTVEAASFALSDSRSVFDYLHQIKIREVKSILIEKLIRAQNLGEDIQVTFEANEDVNELPIDSITLVRMLGIILDNAIEALEELGCGTLFVSCLTWEAGVTFIVENTCSLHTPPLDLLWQPNYSTKGLGRGRGFTILSELVQTYPNVSLDTLIENGRFRQALLIETPKKQKKGKQA